jgi:hypothetical protein
MKSIAEMSEEELIKTVLLLYSKDELAANAVASHVALKLVDRRTLLRDTASRRGK